MKAKTPLRASLLDASGSEFQLVGFFMALEDAKRNTLAYARSYWRTPCEWRTCGRTKGMRWELVTPHGRVFARLQHRRPAGQ